MLLAYIDESYTDDFFYLATVVVDGSAILTLETKLDALVAEYADQTALPEGAELHGYELFHGDKDWAALAVRQRINVYERALRAVGSCGAQIILRGMDVGRQRLRYNNPWPPHEVVLEHTLESINRLARTRHEQALVIADEVHTHERHRTNFRDARLYGTHGYQSSKLENLVDTIHFAPSKYSRLLQAADLVAFLHHRRCTVIERNPKAAAANDKLWAHVQPAIWQNWTWTP